MAAADIVAHGLVDPEGHEISGREKFREFWHQFRTTFPDIRVEVQDALVDGDKIMVRCMVRATHLGEGLAVGPTEKAVSFTGMVLAHVRNGQLVEVWDNWDFLSLYQQLGAIPHSFV
jgi:predicted ester cyclase